MIYINYIMKKYDLPKKIPVFPLNNFIIFPKTTVPLNIFEPRYIDMINDAMKSNKFIGMIQPKNLVDKNEEISDLHSTGCLGKIIGFKESKDDHYLIEIKGFIRFEIQKEIFSDKKYREYEVNFKNFYSDLDNNRDDLKFSDLELIFKDLKT